MDYTNEFKKQAAKAFISSKYSPARFCTTFSNRQIDPLLLIEWVKDLAISLQCDADFWQNQSNNQAVIIDRLDAEKEALSLKVCKLAEDNAKLAMENIHLAKTNAVLETSVIKSSLTAINNKTNTYVATTLQDEKIKELQAENEKLKTANRVMCEDLHEEQIQNQSLMAEIEELKSISGYRNDLIFIEHCEKIIERAEMLKEHLKGGK